MRKKINYDNIFTNMCITIPKSIKGDNNIIQEIRISKNKLYSPKMSKSILSNNNKIIQIKKSSIDSNSNNDNADQINTQRQESNQKFKYSIFTNPTNLIYIPEAYEYHTNDKDLKQLIDLMNEPTTKEFGYTNVVEDKICKVYKRMVEGIPVILIKCLARIPYSKDVVFEAISNLDIRKQWDSVFSDLRVVNHEGENGAEILYMVVKSPVFLVSDREFVQQRKIWKNFPTNKSHILHFISIENHACPPNKKCVRAETIISGYYMQDDPEQPDHSILGVLSQSDLKGNIPYFLVNKIAPKSSKNWIKSLIKGCKLVANNTQS